MPLTAFEHLPFEWNLPEDDGTKNAQASAELSQRPWRCSRCAVDGTRSGTVCASSPATVAGDCQGPRGTAPNAPPRVGGSNPSRPGSCRLARTAQSFASTLKHGLKRATKAVAVHTFCLGPWHLHATLLVIAGHPPTVAPAKGTDGTKSFRLSVLLLAPALTQLHTSLGITAVAQTCFMPASSLCLFHCPLETVW